MATQTTNLNLVKPDYTDAADIAVINGNMDTIDSHVHGNDVDIAGIATIITGTTNNSGHSISSGEYFIANGAKYKATATIGTGVTWADKSSSVSDHDLINALNSKLTPLLSSSTTNVTIQDRTATEVLSISLSAGIWLVVATVDFYNNHTGVKGFMISTTSNTFAWRGATVTQYCNGSDHDIVMNGSEVITLNSSAKVYVNAYTAIGNSSTVSERVIKAIRLV